MRGCLLVIVVAALVVIPPFASRSEDGFGGGGPSSAIPAAVDASPLKPVSFTEVKADIARTICVLVHERQDGRKSFSFIKGQREACTGGEGATPLSRAVDHVLDEARLVLASIGVGDAPFEYKEDASVAEQSKAMQDAFLAVESFLRPILSRLGPALAAEGLVCTDCPSAAASPVRRVTWQEFLPYLQAHVWPDPVRTPVDEQGRPTGEPKYSLHICAGINGISAMKLLDGLLRRAGFIAAMGTEEVREKAVVHLDTVITEDAFLKLGDDAARTAHLRRRVGEEIGKDAGVRAAVCSTLGTYAVDLGLAVVDCAVPETTAP